MDSTIILVSPCLAQISKLCIELIGVLVYVILIACSDVWINLNFCLMSIQSIHEL